jgi:hypothetical protein
MRKSTSSLEDRFNVGDIVRYSDFQPLMILAVHDAHGLYYDVAWISDPTVQVGFFDHKDLRYESGSYIRTIAHNRVQALEQDNGSATYALRAIRAARRQGALPETETWELIDRVLDSVSTSKSR